MADRRVRGAAGTSDLSCALALSAPFVGAVLLIGCHLVGIRPGEGILADLPRLPSSETGLNRFLGEALVLAFVAAAAVVPAGLVVTLAVIVTDRLRVPEPAGSRICAGLGLAAYVAYLAAIVLHPGWGWFVVAGAGPVVAALVVTFVIGWRQDRRETRQLVRAREGRVKGWRSRWQAAASRTAETSGDARAEIGASAPPAPPIGAGASLADEAAAWHASVRVEERTSWPVSRRKCAALALAIPIALVLATWFSFAAGLVDLGGAPGGVDEDVSAVAIFITLGVIFGALGLAAIWEYGRLAIVGGGFEARPEGLLFRFGTTNRWFAWSEVGRIAVEKRKASTVLVIEFPERGMRWPRALTLSTSDTGTLCVSSQVFADPVEGIAKGIRQAKYRFRKRSLLLGGTPDASQLG